MKSTTTALAFAASLLALPAEARNLPSISQPKVINLSTQRRAVSDPIARDRMRRRDTTTATLDNQETLYFVNATLGTPPQPVRLHLDTGSSDLWVNTADSELCSERSAPCAFAGTYTANSSSTYGYVGSWFNISYVDGSGASGDYVTDTITIGETKLSDFQFGVGYESTSEQGILGIGYSANEVQVGRAGMDAYDNLPMKMVSSGQISRNAYSLWLNDLDASTGSILFGGVDTAQYTGSLQTLPIQSNNGAFAEFLVTLTSLSLGNKNIADNQALAVLFDSGSSLSYLPNSMVEDIYNEVQAQYDSSVGGAYVPCALADETATLDFDFSGAKISVEMNELVLDLSSPGQRGPTLNGKPACLFGISPAGSGTNVLGDTFLRSAYVVFDLGNNQISLAQTNFNTTESRVTEIPSGSGAIPDATPVANAVEATEGVSRGNGGTSSGNAGLGGINDHSAAAALRPVLSAVSALLVGVLVAVI